MICKSFLSNTFLNLLILNSIVLCWAFHYYSGIHWEALLFALPPNCYYMNPLVDDIYDAMVLTLLLNIIVLVRKTWKKTNLIHSVWQQFIRNLYYITACVELCIGFFYIQFSNTDVFMNTDIFFYVLNAIWGEDIVNGILSAEYVYVALCIIFFITILVDSYTAFRQSIGCSTSILDNKCDGING